MTLGQAIGARIREAREVRRFTQADLAIMVRMTRPRLCELERGKHQPLVGTVAAICDAMRLDANWLLGLGNGDKPGTDNE